jgi:hypothetical protein
VNEVRRKTIKSLEEENRQLKILCLLMLLVFIGTFVFVNFLDAQLKQELGECQQEPKDWVIESDETCQFDIIEEESVEKAEIKPGTYVRCLENCMLGETFKLAEEYELDEDTTEEEVKELINASEIVHVCEYCDVLL